VNVRFLLDENLSPRLKNALRLRYPDMDVLRVGDEGAPPLSTPDPEILHFLEQEQRILVTDNRASMPGHIANHLAAGGHHWGILNISPHLSFSRIVDELGIVWGASTQDEWFDTTRWIP
jgi:hypothetical protein